MEKEIWFRPEVENTPKSGRPKLANAKENVAKIKVLIEKDTRYTVRDIARMVGLSLSSVQFVLKQHQQQQKNVRKIIAMWVFHLLIYDQM